MAAGVQFTMQAIQATAPKFLKGAINLTLRKRFILSYLIKAGRVMYNETGPEIIWKVKYRKPDTRTANGNPDVFTSIPTYKELRLGFAHLKSPNMIDQLTLAVNKASEQQIINLADDLIKDSVESITESITDQLYLDNASDASALQGLGTIFKPRVGSLNDLYAIPAVGATYGGLSMELGAFGGRCTTDLGTGNFPNTALGASSTDWPEGQPTTQFDFLAPKMFNYTGNWSGGGTNTWRSNCEMVMRRAPTAIDALGGEGAAPTLFLMNRSHYDTFQDQLQDRERLHPSDYAKNLGFPQVMEYSGSLIAFDWSCPANKSYAINPQEMALCSMFSDLLYTNGPEYSIKDEAYLFRVGFLGNTRFNPKYMAEFGSYEPA